ncbi:MAG: RagB/SusD family nutrient uptake outer membrane protein [Paenibacillus sp.]|nr:RagB/SusD family nutrient uptake outer membrane protein [Paenibacillus sp.]
MKSKIFTAAAVTALLSLNSCDIELVPKGETTLDTTAELEYLMNTANFTQAFPYSTDISIIVNESYGNDYSAGVVGRINRGNTLAAAYLSYDANIDRALLATTDQRYTDIYKLINGLNIVLGKVDETSGDADHKQRLKAEAKIERAYYHFLLAGMYAAQYDEATAANTGGIAYVTDYNNDEQKRQLTLDKVYANIMQDLNDDEIELLPDYTNVVRLSKYSGYAIKSRILFQMKNYPEALKYALEALKGDYSIEDRSYIADTHRWILKAASTNNFWYISSQSTSSAVNYEQLSLETIRLFEPGDLTKDYAYANGRVVPGNEAYNYNYGQSDSGIKGCCELATYDVFTNCWGLTVERIMYLAAECYIRTGQPQKGLDLVNEVRKHRIHPDFYTPFTANNEEDAMALYQPARFIENLATYENFFDQKRWNTEDKYKKTISREVPGLKTYTLTPESPLWIIPFPANVLLYNDSFSQNY